MNKESKKTIRSFRDLDIWKKSIELVKDVNMITNAFPKSEIYNLVNQIRRSAVSVPSNISEGQIRQHTREFKQFLYISLGSLAELETQLIIAFELNYFGSKDFNNLEIKIHELGRMIRGLIKKL